MEQLARLWIHIPVNWPGAVALETALQNTDTSSCALQLVDQRVVSPVHSMESWGDPEIGYV